MTVPGQLEDAPCPLGCPDRHELVVTGCDLLGGLPGEFDVVRCRTCGLLRTNPRPTPDAIGLYYPDDYGPYLDTQVRQAPPVKAPGITRVLKHIATRLVEFNSTRLPPMVPGRMLELGCASGSYLHQMAGRGWQVQGIEFSERAARAAAQLGYHVHSGPLETAPEPDEPFDLVVGWMVLEHLHDPLGCLTRLRHWVRPGAWLVLSMPNAASGSFRLFRENWLDLHLPNHLYHFTPRTVGLVLEASGWKLDRVHHQRVLGSLFASAGHFLRARGRAELGQKCLQFSAQPGRWNYALYPLAWLLSVFGQTGRMTVWARVR